MIVPIAAGLLALPLLLRNVHQQVFTLFLLSYGAINFAPSLDLGVARTAQRRTAYAVLLPVATQSLLIRYALRRARIVSAAVALVVMAGTAELFPRQPSLIAHVALVAVTGAGVAIAIYANCQRGVLEGLGAFSRSALNRAAVGIMLVCAPLLVSFIVHDAATLSLAALLVRFPFVWEQHRAIDAALARRDAAGVVSDEDMTSGFMRESGWFALFSVLAIAMSGFDRYIMIALGGLAGQPLAIFLATQDMALRAIMLPAALLPALTVRLAAGGGDRAEMTRALSKRLFFVIVPGAVAGCTIGAALSRVIVRLLYPQLPVETTAATLLVLFVGIVTAAIAQFPLNRLVSAGRARDAALTHVGEFAIYLLCIPYVITNYGAQGAAAMWSGRIVLNATILVVWSGITQDDRAMMMWEVAAMVLGVGSILTIGMLA